MIQEIIKQIHKDYIDNNIKDQKWASIEISDDEIVLIVGLIVNGIRNSHHVRYSYYYDEGRVKKSVFAQ